LVLSPAVFVIRDAEKAAGLKTKRPALQVMVHVVLLRCIFAAVTTAHRQKS